MKDIIKATLALIFVAALAIFVFYKGDSTTPQKDYIPEGRVDIYVPQEKNNILKVEFNNTLKNKEDWSTDNEWYVMQSTDKKIIATIAPLKEKEITVELKGPWEKGKDDKLIEHWVKFSSLKIDGKEILTTPQMVWHNQHYDHKFTGKKNKTYKIEATWEPK